VIREARRHHFELGAYRCGGPAVKDLIVGHVELGSRGTAPLISLSAGAPKLLA
jgi:hypothetical protein